MPFEYRMPERVSARERFIAAWRVIIRAKLLTNFGAEIAIISSFQRRDWNSFDERPLFRAAVFAAFPPYLPSALCREFVHVTSRPFSLETTENE